MTLLIRTLTDVQNSVIKFLAYFFIVVNLDIVCFCKKRSDAGEGEYNVADAEKHHQKQTSKPFTSAL